jgi:hypothetical protein
VLTWWLRSGSHQEVVCGEGRGGGGVARTGCVEVCCGQPPGMAWQVCHKRALLARQAAWLMVAGSGTCRGPGRRLGGWVGVVHHLCVQQHTRLHSPLPRGGCREEPCCIGWWLLASMARHRSNNLTGATLSLPGCPSSPAAALSSIQLNSVPNSTHVRWRFQQPGGAVGWGGLV